MLEIKLFGATTVTTPHGAVLTTGLGGTKPRQILEILALSAGTPVPKEYLADLLWDGQPPRSYLGTLESYVCVLRKSLGLARGRGSTIATVAGGYVLGGDAVRVDLQEFRELVRQASAPTATPATALVQLEQAMALVHGEVLAGEAYATWAIRERNTFQRELVATATLAATRAIELGQHDVAVRMARTAIAHDMLAEGAWRLLMRALKAAGRPSEALRAYFELRDHLAAELGADPSRETSDLYVEILRDDDSERQVGRLDAREEVKMLMSLLRQAVASIPGLEEPRSNRALAEMAAQLAA